MTEALTLAQRLHDRAKWRGTIRNRADIELDREAADALEAKDAEFQHFQTLASEHRAELETEIAHLRETNKVLEAERDEKIARALAKADYEAERAGDIENENDRLAAQVKVAKDALAHALGIIVEFGDLNGFRNLSDEELGRAVQSVAKECADALASLPTGGSGE